MVYSTALSLTVSLFVLSTLAVHGVTGNKDRKHYCGQDLVDSLSILCDGWYKRAGRIHQIPTNNPDQQDIEDTDDLLLRLVLHRNRALGMLQGRAHRTKRGVIEECCRNACTVSELREYCGSERD